MDQIYRRYEEPGHLTIGEDWMTTSQQWRGPHPVSSGRVSPLPWAELHVLGMELSATRWIHHFLPVVCDLTCSLMGLVDGVAETDFHAYLWLYGLWMCASWLHGCAGTTVLLSLSLAGRASPLPRAELHDPVSLACSTTGQKPSRIRLFYGAGRVVWAPRLAVVMVLRLLCFGTCFSFASG